MANQSIPQDKLATLWRKAYQTTDEAELTRIMAEIKRLEQQIVARLGIDPYGDDPEF